MRPSQPPGPPPSDGASTRVSARLSAWQAGALVVASMVGTGVFTTSGFLVAELGRPWAVLLVWLVAGALALAGAAVYAELGGMFPRVGGEYVYLSQLHPALGFLAGFLSLVVGFAAPMAAGAEAFTRYLMAAWPALPLPPWAAGYLLLAAVTGLHAREVRTAGRLQGWLTGLNLLAIAGLTAAGGAALLLGPPLPAVPVASAPLPTPGPGGFAVALVFVSYAYFGWNAAAYVAGELAEPGRTLPRVLLVGCGLVTGLYLAVNAVILALVPAPLAAGKLEIAHLAAERAFGLPAARLLSGLIAVILAASVGALAMTGARVAVAMAEDGVFFPVFARRNRRGAPAPAVLLLGALAALLALTATFEALLVYVGFTLSLSAAATVSVALVLRRRAPAAPRPYRAPLWPLPPLAFIVSALWMIGHAASHKPRETAAGAATVLVGLLLFVLRRRRPAGDERSAPPGR